MYNKDVLSVNNKVSTKDILIKVLASDKMQSILKELKDETVKAKLYKPNIH